MDFACLREVCVPEAAYIRQEALSRHQGRTIRLSLITTALSPLVYRDVIAI